MRLMVLSAISRDSSTCFILADHIVEICKSHGVDVDFAHPANVNVPVNDGNVPWDLPEAKAWQERIAETDAHIWVSPEYHSAMTGGFKNLFDYLVKEPLKGDVVGLCALAGGAMAALNTLNGMSVMARSLGAWVAPDYIAMNSNEVKDGIQEGSERRLRAMCHEVIDGARRFNASFTGDYGILSAADGQTLNDI